MNLQAVSESMESRTTIVGLEVHVQLATRSKLFCACSTAFGAPPNSHTCAICVGMPGTLPVMNREAFQLALRTAVALNCEIPTFTKWDRKQYYYPDLPKGYQISQYDLPMSQHGYLEISDAKESFPTKRIRILRAHLEEDAGKSLHDELAGKGDSLIDLNRTGTPLLEIVTEPDIRSSVEAKEFLNELKLLLTYLGVSDCNMQEGSLRVDANVNLHIETPSGAVATPIVEIKNLNSFRAVERALDFESERQWEMWKETGIRLGDVSKETRSWDDGAGVTRALRSKEESSDYRYFPDPDLVPVTVTADEIAEARSSLGELPAMLRERLQTQFQLPAYDADVLVNQGRDFVEYFLKVADRAGDGKAAANWVTQDVLRTLKESGSAIADFGLSANQLAGLIQRIRSGEVPTARSRELFLLMLEEGIDLESAIGRLGIERVDDSELTDLCKELLQANPKIVADVQRGNVKALGALIGQAKKRNANADPNRVREICLELIRAESLDL